MITAKNIVITGGSSGLGAALALEYAESGIVLGLLGRNQGRLEAVARQCRAKGAVVVTGLADTRDRPALEEWLKAFDSQYPIDLCIANAGISAGTGSGGETAEQANRIFDVNVGGVLNTILPASELMRLRRKGRIAIVSSMASFRGSPAAPAYSASKAAVRYYGQALQGFLEPDGIGVSVVCPGFIKTPMTDINPFPMPFMMSAEKAAVIIRNGLEKRKNLIAFPWPMVLLARMQSLLPDNLINKIYRAVPSKPQG